MFRQLEYRLHAVRLTLPGIEGLPKLKLDEGMQPISENAGLVNQFSFGRRGRDMEKLSEALS